MSHLGTYLWHKSEPVHNDRLFQSPIPEVQLHAPTAGQETLTVHLHRGLACELVAWGEGGWRGDVEGMNGWCEVGSIMKVRTWRLDGWSSIYLSILLMLCCPVWWGERGRSISISLSSGTPFRHPQFSPTPWPTYSYLPQPDCTSTHITNITFIGLITSDHVTFMSSLNSYHIKNTPLSD